MSIDKLTPLGENGSLENEATFEDWVAGGFVDERVRYTRLNRQLYRADDAINELIRCTPPGVDTREDSVALNVYGSDSFIDPQNSANRISVGTSSSDFVSVYPTKISGVRKVLAIDLNSAAAEIELIDSETMTHEDTIDLSAGLGAGTWAAQGVCADGTNAYVCFEDASYNQFIQAYRMSDWSVVAGWPANGTDYGTGSGSLDYVKVVNADADFLAIAHNNSTTFITLIDKSDGSIDDTGNGDSTASGTQNLQDLCSNGTYLFFYLDGDLCSAQISNLSNGCGGTGWPYTSTFGGRTACAGTRVVSVGGGGVIAADSISIYGSFTFATPSDDVFDDPGNVAFDGKSFWVLGVQDPSDAGNARSCIARLKIGWVSRGQNGVSAKTDIAPYVEVYNFLDASFGPATFIDASETTLIHDGRDLWFGGVYDASTKEFLFRIPLTRWL